MSTEQSQKSFGKAGAWSITPLQRPASRVIEGPQYEEPTGGPEEWQKLLNSLQQWVCELLIKNQELRMALESAAAQEKEKYTLPVLAGTRRKLRMNIDQKINSIADSNQEVTKVLYTAKTHTSGGRRGGVSRSDDGRLDLKFGAPGVPETGTNPEQLFAAGWSACFISAMGHVASKMKVKLPPDAAVDAEIDLCNSGSTYFLQARLNVSLPGLEREVAQAIVEATHAETCAYSNATRGNIDVTLNVA